jgi:hypothetical protein
MKSIALILLLTPIAFLQAPATATGKSEPVEEVVVPFTLAVDLSNLPAPGGLIDRQRSLLPGEDAPLLIW